MSEKKFAPESDLKAHINSDPKVVHGMLEVTKSVIAAAIAEALAALVHIQGGSYIEDPLIQVGLASSTPVTFGVAYKAATTPYVTGNSILTTEAVSITARSNTAFSYTNVYTVDGSAGAGNVVWIAIGEKA